MLASKKALELIAEHEGFRSAPYLCPAQKWTIGFGHTSGVTASSPPITREQALELLRADLDMISSELRRLIRVEVTQSEFDALASFAFNVGVGNLAGSTLLKLLNAGDKRGAAEQFERWVYATVNGEKARLPGLVRRRQAERALFEARDGE